MGTYSPAPIMSDAMNRQVMETIIEPTMAAMKAEGCAYKGVLFAGLMIVNGQAKLLEFNVRFGDPETQVMMARLTSDIMPALMACRDGGLQHVAIEFTSYAAVCVVMASNGYPGSYQKGTEIHHLDKAAALPSTLVFHAGTKYDDGSYTAIGGRVLGVTARGDNIEQAQAHAYRAVDAIDWPEGFCRRDIGWRAIKQKVA
jgi:phosphoribosylamine--glycine ligase